MAQHQRLTGPTAVNAAAPFTSSMVDGYHPESPRIYVQPKGRRIPQIGWSIAQTTHTAATFTPDMVQGSHPDASRAFIAPKPGWSISQTTHTDAPFTPSMSAGWHPDAPAKIFLGPKLGWAMSQTTHVAAAFSPEMSAGWKPDRAVLGKPRPDGWLANLLTFDIFSIEMVQGWHPDRAVLGKPSPRDWSIAQPSPVAAPFGIEMVRGWLPDVPRVFLKPQFGWQSSQTTFDVPMTAEQFAGSHPDTARLWLAPRLPQPFSQTTHIAAPFSHEMVQGVTATRWRAFVAPKPGWSASQTTFELPMTPDQFAGWHPDRSRAFLAPRLPLPISQTTQTSAPFSHEMVQGAQPPFGRTKQYGKQIVGWIQGLIDGLFGTQAVAPAGRSRVRTLAARTVRDQTEVPVTTSVSFLLALDELEPGVVPVLAFAPAHGLIDGDRTIIAGANVLEYNGTYEVFRLDADNFEYFFAGSLSAGASGPITSTKIPIPTARMVRALTRRMARVQTVPSGYHVLVLADGAEAYWRLGEAQGLLLADATGHGHTMTLASAVGVTYGVAGALADGTTGLAFNGTTAFRGTCAPIVTGTTFTIEFWITPNGDDGFTYQTILTAGAPSFDGIYRRDSTIGAHANKLTYFHSFIDHYNTTPLVNGVCYHVVLSVTAGAGTWYLNGVADGTVTGIPSANLQQFFCLPAVDGNDPLKVSLLDDLIVSPGIALSAAQVATHYHVGRTGELAATAGRVVTPLTRRVVRAL